MTFSIMGSLFADEVQVCFRIYVHAVLECLPKGRLLVNCMVVEVLPTTRVESYYLAKLTKN